MRPADPEASPLAQIQKFLLHPDVSVQRAALDAMQVDVSLYVIFSPLSLCAWLPFFLSCPVSRHGTYEHESWLVGVGVRFEYWLVIGYFCGHVFSLHGNRWGGRKEQGPYPACPLGVQDW